jgi:hypothetical protein
MESGDNWPSDDGSEQNLLRSRQRVLIVGALLAMAAIVALGVGFVLWLAYDFIVEGARD